MKKTFELPPGYRIERTDYGFALFAPDGQEVLRRGEYLNPVTSFAEEWVQGVLTEFACHHANAESALKAGQADALNNATGHQRLMALIGSSVVSVTGQIDSPFEGDEFSITFSNGLTLSFEDMKWSNSYILSLRA